PASIQTPVQEQIVERSSPAATRKRTWEEWHRIMGHVSQKVLEHMAKDNMVDGLSIDELSSTDYFCEACVQAKQRVSAVPQESKSEYTSVRELTVTDVWGPAQWN